MYFVIQSLISNNHYAGEEVNSKLDSLSLEHHKLIELWEQRHNIFNQCYQLQVGMSVLVVGSTTVVSSNVHFYVLYARELKCDLFSNL